MTPLIFALVLLAAFLHASWNLVVKIAADGFLAIFLLQTLMGVMGLAMLAFFTFPVSAAWGFALTSGVLHTGYNLFLARSYKFGDLGLVYPVARGTAPLLTLIGSQLFTHDAISTMAMFGVVTLIIGMWLIALSSNVFHAHRGTFLFALTTSVFIGCYTIVDGLGGRASGNPSGYTGLVFVLDAIGMLVVGLTWKGIGIFKSVAPSWKAGLLGAGMSGTAYWIVIWAMAQAPIAAVAACAKPAFSLRCCSLPSF
ncbi:MAG: EamA family transporter [Aestuariivirga sp.]